MENLKRDKWPEFFNRVSKQVAQKRAEIEVQSLDIGDQMPGGVGIEIRMRCRLAASALVEQQHVIARRVEQATMVGRDAAARPAMQKDGRLRAGGADPLPIDMMAIADVEMTGGEGGDRGIERSHGVAFSSPGLASPCSTSASPGSAAPLHVATNSSVGCQSSATSGG